MAAALVCLGVSICPAEMASESVADTKTKHRGKNKVKIYTNKGKSEGRPTSKTRSSCLTQFCYTTKNAFKAYGA